MDIHILNEAKTTINNNGFILNPENLTILIALSPASYINNLLQTSFDLSHSHYHYIARDTHAQSLRYWDRCIIPYHNYFDSTSNCNFNEYITTFINVNNSNNKYKKHSKYILFESTPSYIIYYHSCYLLSHYASLYHIYFYVSLQNPTYRTWYEYWMHFNFKYNENNTFHIEKMIEKIDIEIDLFAHSYPKYQRLLDYIRIENDSLSNNNDIDEEKVVDLWIDSTYDLFNNFDYNSFKSKADINDMIEGKYSAFSVPIFAISLYYPQVLMWYQTFKNNTINLSGKLKIFQFNQTQTQTDAQNVINQLLLWIQTAKSNTNIDFQKEYFKEKVVELKHNGLINKLNEFYHDCNLRLYWFLKQHPDLLLFTNRVLQF